MNKKGLILSILVLIGVSAVTAQVKFTDRVMVLPFENTSGKPEFNWVGESFALSLSELLHVPGLNVVSNGERKAVQQRLRIPLTSLPSIATSLKLSRESGATLLITGTYTIVPSQGDLAATVNVTSKIIRVNEGRFLSEEIDGRLIQRDIILNDALGNLQTMQGQIAYQILYQRDKALPFSQNQLIESATKVPSRAFEAYIKGLLTNAPEQREIFFRNAVRIFNETTPDSTFVEAALELGHLYLAQQKFNDAIDSFERVINTNRACRERAKSDNKIAFCNDESYAEASFYIGLIYWRQKNYEQALGVLRPIAEDLQLTSVYNTLGAIAVEASRAEKKNDARSAALLKEGTDLLAKAAESDPDDISILFNLGVATFVSGELTDAAPILRSVIVKRPSDGEAHYLLAKALEGMNDPAKAGADNQARALLTSANRYATLESEWTRSKTVTGIPLRVEQPQRRDFVSVVLSRRDGDKVATAANESDTLLQKARDQYKNGADDDAMQTLRRVLASEPMSAESYLILGKIHLRRGDRDQAASSFKTAIFWDNKLTDAYINLAKIHIERGECLQVKTYVAQALEVDPENPEVTALQRQADRC
ncbi:MAG: tetratricopeptide repeat protein, partial [bacterium]|nr:tetratricopeptide repeat protein [bacterium]